MIFVDTSAWFAVYSRRDVNHTAAERAVRSFIEPLVTSDYVIDEALTLMRARGENRRAIAFGKRVIDGKSAKIVTITEPDFAEAWHLFQRFADKEWSFTDCTSRVLMERLGIQRAFAFDDHFRQFGTVTVMPYGTFRQEMPAGHDRTLCCGPTELRILLMSRCRLSSKREDWPPLFKR